MSTPENAFMNDMDLVYKFIKNSEPLKCECMMFLLIHIRKYPHQSIKWCMNEALLEWDCELIK